MAKFSIFLGVFAGVALAALALPALAATGDSPAGAKITLAQARQIALTAQSGQIMDSAIEAGVGGARYSFDILSHANGTTREVEVDANTGAILENSITTDLPAAPANKRAPRSM
jgi:hypothetical protein